MTNLGTRPDKHDWRSASYVEEWVNDWSARTEREGQLRRVAVAVPFDRDAEIKVLDVGGGWGPLSEQVLRYRPRAQVTLVDFSAPMLEHAAARFAAAGRAVTLVQADLRDPDWAGELDGPYDAVVSSLAIHNLVDADLITRVYADVLGLLKPEGCFLNLEIVFAAGPRLATIGRRLRGDGAGNDPDEVEQVEPLGGDPSGSPAGSPLPRSLESQLQWLHSVGFSEVDCLWRDVNLALLVALR